MGRAAAGTTHRASPLPHRARDTRVCIIPTSHRASLCLLASQLCLSCSCLCPPYPYICPLHLQWKWSGLTDHHTSPSSDTGQNGIVPSVKSECFISGSTFGLFMHDGEERWGDHCVAGLAGGRRYFSRSGSSSQLPCSCERKQHAWKCSCEAQYRVSLRLKSRFTPIEKTILPAWAHDTVISLWTLILADSFGTACYFHCSWVVRYFTSLFIKNQEGSILRWNEKNNSSFNLTCIYFMRRPFEMTNTIFIFLHKDILCKRKNSGLHFLFFFFLSVMKELLSVVDTGCQDFIALNRLLAAGGKVKWINLHWNNSLYFKKWHLFVSSKALYRCEWIKLYSNPVRGVNRACVFHCQAQKAPDLSRVRLNAPDPKCTEINKRFPATSRHSELRPKLVTEIEEHSWPSNLSSNFYFRLLPFLMF